MYQNSQLKTYQILTNDDQLLILCLSYFITNVTVKFSFQGEAGEKKEGDLEEVKIDIETEDDEKKDAEKPEPPYSKYLNQLKEGGNACQLKYNALER